MLSFTDYRLNKLLQEMDSDELIQKLMLIMPEGPALTLNPDFFMYQAYAAQVNREIAFVDAGSDLTFDLETILTKIDEVQPSFLL